MKFECAPGDFAEAVSIASGSLASRPTSPVLGGIRIEADSDFGVSLSSYDWDRATQTSLEADVVTDDVVLVSGRLLVTIAKVLPKRRKLTIIAEDSSLIITSGATQFTLPLLAVGEYPKLPEPGLEIGKISAEALKRCVDYVHYAAGTDATVPTLTAIELRTGNGQLTCTATDRYTVASASIPWKGDDIAVPLPAKDFAAAVRHLGDDDQVTLHFDGKSFALSAPNYWTTVPILDVEFPAGITGALKSQFGVVVKVNADELATSLRSAAKIGGQNINLVDIGVHEDILTISSERYDDEIAVALDGVGREFRINAEYLANALVALRSLEVYLCFDLSLVVALFPGKADIERDEPIKAVDRRSVVQGIRTPETG